MKQIIDNFSSTAADYAIYRPESPREVFDFLYSNVNGFGTAWDCGTGNGQVATKLAERFKLVYGTDISTEQLHHAVLRNNIIYMQQRAEQCSLPDRSVDLITVGQAIHWFDFDAFYKEVCRVARPGALIAAWTYTVLRLTPAVNEVIDHLYLDITHAYWDKQRDLVDARYRTLPFPFKEVQSPDFEIVKKYSLKQLIGYLSTWSGVRHYMMKEKTDPVAMITADLEKAWGRERELEVRWPVHMRAGRIG